MAVNLSVVTRFWSQTLGRLCRSGETRRHIPFGESGAIPIRAFGTENRILRTYADTPSPPEDSPACSGQSTFIPIDGTPPPGRRRGYSGEASRDAIVRHLRPEASMPTQGRFWGAVGLDGVDRCDWDLEICAGQLDGRGHLGHISARRAPRRVYGPSSGFSPNGTEAQLYGPNSTFRHRLRRIPFSAPEAPNRTNIKGCRQLHRNLHQEAARTMRGSPLTGDPRLEAATRS